MIKASPHTRPPAASQRLGRKQENQQKHVHKETHEILLIIIYICIRATNAHLSLRKCQESPEPSLYSSSKQQTDRQTGRQAGRKAGRQAGRQSLHRQGC